MPLPGTGSANRNVQHGAVPSDTVVDRDCRTFDNPNLYICDGGVIPELSEKNPHPHPHHHGGIKSRKPKKLGNVRSRLAPPQI